MLNLEALQAQLASSARLTHETEAVANFTCYFNPNESEPYANSAMPDTPMESAPYQALDALVACFEKRQRVPHVEFIESFSPLLPSLLETYGFDVEDRNPLQVATVASFVQAPVVEGLAISCVDDDATLDELRAFITVQGRAFAGDDRSEASAAEASRFRAQFDGVQFYLACLKGEPVAAGSLTIPLDGIAEVAGIGTLSAYRRRGIASAVTAAIAESAFA